MIISKDTNPAKDLYYVGGLILQHFIKNDIISTDYYELVNVLKSEHKISTNLLFLSLDWLYMLGSININDKGDIVICF
jgi:hypothetical protein